MNKSLRSHENNINNLCTCFEHVTSLVEAGSIVNKAKLRPTGEQIIYPFFTSLFFFKLSIFQISSVNKLSNQGRGVGYKKIIMILQAPAPVGLSLTLFTIDGGLKFGQNQDRISIHIAF